MAMTVQEARAARRPKLEAELEAAVCAQQTNPAPGDWFRRDGEGGAEWRKRRAQLLVICQGCPARIACHELALREGDGDRRRDDRVRGGAHGTQLYRARLAQEDRLEQARREDEELTLRQDTRARGMRRLLEEACRATTRPAVVSSRVAHQASAELAERARARRVETGWGAVA
ncbi:hypothetical protein [Streptomyces sp. NPDC057702]|uniref:hypothetical protein n=1 Tax=Streptomyces sp. NPDC057702 TaxID=3346221 RepID=UPI0036C23508